MTNRKHWAALQASTSVRRWGESVERCLPSFLHKQTRTNGQITFSTAIEMQRKAISIQTPCSLIAWAAQSEDCVHMTLRALYCNSKKHNGSSYLLGLFLLFYQPFIFHSHLFICNPLNNWFIIYFWCAPFFVICSQKLTVVLARSGKQNCVLMCIFTVLPCYLNYSEKKCKIDLYDSDSCCRTLFQPSAPQSPFPVDK